MKNNEKRYIAYAIVIAALTFAAGLMLGSSPQLQTVQLPEERVIQMALPAVDNNGNGVSGTLITTVKPGSGRILLDTSKVLNYIDTQLSSRTAAIAAGNYAKTNLSNLDVIYTIKVNASLIEGPSAGASMALSVLLALDNRTADDVAITGTINSDGSIGRVGSVLEKARTAKESGVRLFLVPAGQANEGRVVRDVSCSKTGMLDVCEINYNSRNVSITEAGLEIREVSNLEEAYSYFTSPSP